MDYAPYEYLSDNDIANYICQPRNKYCNYRYLGAHFMNYKGSHGVCFMVQANHAVQVNLVGQFNDWNGTNHPMKKVGSTGIWHIFVSEIKEGDLYKYEIHGENQSIVLKADPYGFYHEVRPNTATLVKSLDKYCWNDRAWVERVSNRNKCDEIINIYEMHMGSWRHRNGREVNYRDITDQLVNYLIAMDYTYVEFMPVMEHPFDGSWGYQLTGYYAITSRYGMPEDFMYLVDQCHQHGIGVILDWVPCHFCKDEHGLRCFDGTPMYEYDNPVMAENDEWGTLYFDLGKPVTEEFLISNALFWFDQYHIDGLRVDAVSYMLYLDAGRKEGRWIPNEEGGRENKEAIRFFQKLNQTISERYPKSLMIAEESTAWPNVTGSVEIGGLGFDLKWNMGWMNDVLRYMCMDPIYRKWHHHLICFSFQYAYSEKFILALSHDEVVHGKKSLLDKMPGDYWNKFAGLRALYGFMMGHPGKKLLFMGGEFGQFIEWDEKKELDWMLLEYDSHRHMQEYMKDLNNLYKTEGALNCYDFHSNGFEWIDSSNHEESIIVFMRKSNFKDNFIIVICNFTPVVRTKYKVGVPSSGKYQIILNSDEIKYGGSGVLNVYDLAAKPSKWNGRPWSIEITVPPLSVVFCKFKM